MKLLDIMRSANALAILGLCSCTHPSSIPPSSAHINNPTALTDTQAHQETASKQESETNSQTPYQANTTESDILSVASNAPVYSIVVYDTPVREVLFAMARDSKINMDIHPSIDGRVTLNAVNQTLAAILTRISKQVNLRYVVENNVLIISPDQPELRTYKIDYVNMSRDTTGFIGAAAEIASTGQSASTGAGGNSTITNTSGNGANNSSRTAVNSDSKNKFWETLERNIKDILAETDKEIVITRLASPKTKKSTSKQNNTEIPDENDQQRLQEEYSEFKTLYAATVIVNREAGVINVRATAKQHERVQHFIQQVLDSVKRQVLIEATIVEVKLSESFQAGIDWSRLNNSLSNSGFQFRQQLGPQTNSIYNSGNDFSTGVNALGGSTGAAFIAGYLNPTGRLGNISASIQLLEQFGSTKVLSSPKIMVLNNQTAVLKVVDNVVYFTVQAQQSQGTVGGVLSTVTTTANTVPVGVVMTVTPQINDTGNVNINVRPTVSRVLGYKSDPNPNLKIESLVPEIQVREMESMLQILSGNTAVLGGLMQDDIANFTDAVPGLSNIPLIGHLFTGKNRATRKTELVIFMRPTVIHHASLNNAELSGYQQYLPLSQLKSAH
jgi:general secretion pathway protein D